MIKNYLILLFALILSCIGFAQNTEIKGKIINAETNSLISGANIVITDTHKGTISDMNGEFLLTSDEEIASITVSYLGYETQIVKVNSQSLIIKLKPNISMLNEVVVNGVYTKPVKRTSDAIYTGTAMTSKGIELMGVSASTSVYNTIDLMPAINTESNDAYGLSDKSVRIRCIKDNFSGMSVDGFPNYGIMPIGARDDIYDMENIQQVSVYKGATPADLGTATGSKGGAIELKYRRPSEKFGVHLKQSLGMDNYSRSFARIDVGKLKTKTGIFASCSYTQADKWKGFGSLGPRKNFVMGIQQLLSKKVEIEIFANYNQIDRHDFMPLTYTQALDIKHTKNMDFNPELTGNPSDDMYYYGYNGGNFINKDFMSIFSYQYQEKHMMEVKYYLSKEDADYKEGVKKGPNYFIFNRKRDIDRMGIIPEFTGEISKIKYSVGYWFESASNHASVYSSAITNEGVQPVGYSYFTVKNENGQVHSPYVKLSYSGEKFSIQAGVKYFNFTDPESERYPSLTPTELSETPNPDLHTDKIKFKALLPTVGIGYQFNRQFEMYFNYGRNYMRPYCYNPIISLYVKNQTIFTEHGMTLQSIFDKWQMETSDNFDLGLRYQADKVSVAPALFYSKHHNVLATAYDAVVDLDYYQNVGSLTALGIEMECYLYPCENLMMYVNPAFTEMTYDEELYRSTPEGHEALGIKGNQSPATPNFSLKSGVTYSVNNITITTKVKYTGDRYGDATNREKIPDYTLVDAYVEYSKENCWKLKEISFGVEIKNIFDEKYIGGIDVMDDRVEGEASYYVGAPLTALATLSIKL